MPLGDALYESGTHQSHVYFPTTSIVSLLYVMEDGSSAEIAVVGNEGIVGVSLFMGGETTPSRGIVQSAGHAYRLSGQTLKQEFMRAAELQHVLLRYTQALLTQMAQTAVCNRHHSVDQQLCRWLLLSFDRLPSNELVMTQELIANMLGVRREGVTEAAGKLQKAGLIRYNRGRISVDRQARPRSALVRVLCRRQEGVRSAAAARRLTRLARRLCTSPHRVLWPDVVNCLTKSREGSSANTHRSIGRRRFAYRQSVAELAARRHSGVARYAQRRRVPAARRENGFHTVTLASAPARILAPRRPAHVVPSQRLGSLAVAGARCPATSVARRGVAFFRAAALRTRLLLHAAEDTAAPLHQPQAERIRGRTTRARRHATPPCDRTTS